MMKSQGTAFPTGRGVGLDEPNDYSGVFTRH